MGWAGKRSSVYPRIWLERRSAASVTGVKPAYGLFLTDGGAGGLVAGWTVATSPWVEGGARDRSRADGKEEVVQVKVKCKVVLLQVAGKGEKTAAEPRAALAPLVKRLSATIAYPTRGGESNGVNYRPGRRTRSPRWTFQVLLTLGEGEAKAERKETRLLFGGTRSTVTGYQSPIAITSRRGHGARGGDADAAGRTRARRGGSAGGGALAATGGTRAGGGRGGARARDSNSDGEEATASDEASDVHGHGGAAARVSASSAGARAGDAVEGGGGGVDAGAADPGSRGSRRTCGIPGATE
ncbi:hypothetical protein FIBSPDRAFT_898371 [Athelia psychrophila]|uniref:Uncharacterized protein n=1 Tax=Athelia psychrophila TaxID=1759441 RepID=A0A166B0F8_9AGAM|nr:hypothetical protein FIBSPDRAFT_898371 [Fibularhizoctonia sp. CBS 109695]